MTALTIVEAAVAGNPDRFALVLPGVSGHDVSKLVGQIIWSGEDPPGAARARGGIPRPVSDIAGEIKAARFDGGRDAAVVEAVFSDKIADLIRRIPSALRLAAKRLTGDRESDVIVLSTGPGVPLDVRDQLLEAAKADPYTPEGDEMTMTLAEALRTPAVVNYLRETLAPPRLKQHATRPPTQVDEARARIMSGEYGRDMADRRSREPLQAFGRLLSPPPAPRMPARLVEAALTTADPAQVFGLRKPDWVINLEKRGLDPKSYGYTPAPGGHYSPPRAS